MVEHKSLKVSTKAAEALDGSITFHFFDPSGAPLDVTGAKARFSELCGQKDDSCWQSLDRTNEGFTAAALTPHQETLVEAEATVKGRSVSFVPALVSVGCNQKKAVQLYMREEPQGRTALAADKVTLTLNAHRCVGRDDHRDRSGAARIVRATAEPTTQEQGLTHRTTATKRPALINADIVAGKALFALQKDTTYRFYAQMEEECANTCPAFPFTWLADEDKEISICVEPRERAISLLFVDSCGKAVAPTEVLWDQRGRTEPLPAAHGGTCTLTGLTVGPLRLLSKSYRFRPEEVSVDDRMNQAHVFEAIKLHAPVEEVNEIILEFAEKIKEGEHGAFRILTVEGKLIETLEARGPQPVRYLPIEHAPLMIQAWRNGKMIEQVHHPGH